MKWRTKIISIKLILKKDNEKKSKTKMRRLMYNEN